MTRRPREVARHLEPEQAKLYELIWTRTIACQMESAELERTTVDILAAAGERKLDFRATGQVVRFPGFLALYQEGRDDEEDEESGRLPPMREGERLAKERIDATQHFTEPPPRYTEATLVKRMEELGIGRPSTYASTIAILRDRDYVRHREEAADPGGQGPAGDGLPRILLRQIRRIRLHRRARGAARPGLEPRDGLEGAAARLLEGFFRARSATSRTCAPGRCSTASTRFSGPHIFPDRGDGVDPRLCPVCGKGQLSLKLGKFGAFIGCANYPECKFTRVLSPSGAESGEGERPGVRVLGQDPETGDEITLRNGRFGEYVQQGEGEKPKRSSLPRGLKPDDVTLEKALKLLALPREVARHPTSGEPILAGIGRYGSYVQHGKTYANLGRDDDVLEIGGNRAIDLIVAKESGAGASRFGGGAGRALGDHPEGGAVSVKQGRFGSYVNHGKINATMPKGTDPASLSLDDAVAVLAAKAAGGGVSGRLVGDHPNGGPVTVREGRFGPYVNWGKVNANIPKSTPPELDHPHRRHRTDRRARRQACADRPQGAGQDYDDKDCGEEGRARKERAGQSTPAKAEAAPAKAKTAPAKAKAAPAKKAAARGAAKAKPSAAARKR